MRLDLGDEHSNTVVSEHVRPLDEAGLIDAKNHSGYAHDSYRWMPLRLTWSGHDFLAAARSDDIWAKAKGRLEKIGGASLTVLFQLLVQIAKQELEIPD